MNAFLTLFSLVSCMGYGAGVSFPTERSCVSPDQNCCIRCITEPQSDDGAAHILFLSRLGSTVQKKIWVTGRSCDVLWSADSQRITITGWTGSNVAGVFWLDVSKPQMAAEIDVKDVQTLGPKGEFSGHCYYEALRWKDPKHLQICIFGHTDENPSLGFAYYILVDTSSGRAKLLKKEDEEPDPECCVPRSRHTTLVEQAPR